MIKALEGRAGRGIRTVGAEEGVEEAFKPCMDDRGQLFSGKALSEGKHTEVQIVCDAAGDVAHLCELQCSVQRRFQKVVEGVMNLDLVRIRLHLCNSATLTSLNLNPTTIRPLQQGCAIQLRLTAEESAKDFRPSPGAIRASFIA
ncbi:hypothetical protein FIBSPDRAFT_1046803 [Athelia psychrophila]|uniref:Carbamoyl phosphate synthase ATP-binding domain-containing protein n=1 Tax=Athelia psychrophila TaxID=1759441 RepID=A0A166G4U7_9AGAM|nr:hypothetical protein FIBSPDRAFT_1046803 [Fibularhizoctonia sp. CBS 109695]